MVESRKHEGVIPGDVCTEASTDGDFKRCRPVSVTLRVLHANIRSLHEKSSDIEVLIGEGSYDLVCFNEHWLSDVELNLLNIAGYRVVSGFSRSERSRGGGVCILESKLEVKPIDVSYCISESLCEAAGVYMVGFNTFIFTLYRTPDSNYQESVSMISLLLDHINFAKYEKYR